MAFMPVSQKAFLLRQPISPFDLRRIFPPLTALQAPGVTSLEAPFVPLINEDGGI